MGSWGVCGRTAGELRTISGLLGATKAGIVAAVDTALTEAIIGEKVDLGTVTDGIVKDAVDELELLGREGVPGGIKMGCCC